MVLAGGDQPGGLAGICPGNQPLINNGSRDLSSANLAFGNCLLLGGAAEGVLPVIVEYLFPAIIVGIFVAAVLSAMAIGGAALSLGMRNVQA